MENYLNFFYLINLNQKNILLKLNLSIKYTYEKEYFDDVIIFLIIYVEKKLDATTEKSLNNFKTILI